MIHVFLWLGLLVILSLTALPLVERLGIPYSSKSIGIIILTFVVWILANFLNFRTAAYVGFFIYVAICTSLLIWLKDFKGSIREIVRFEIVFLASFLLYLLYTAFNPDIFGGEKMMDVGVLSGILRSKGMPPLDVNLAFFRFDCYYYMGYLIVATLTALTGTPIGIAYNLGLATFFALTVSLAVEFSLRNGTKTLPLLLFAGNLVPLAVLVGCGLQSLGLIHIEGLNPGRAFDFWTVTRVIPGTINEFPFATLTFRDLHPHLMDIPFQVLFLVMLFEYVRLKDGRIFAFLSLLLGFMFTVNSWELPTYLALMIVTVSSLRRFEDLKFLPIALVFLPYAIKLHPEAVKGIGIVKFRTALPNFLMAQPLFLIPLFYFALKDWKKFLALCVPTIPIAFLLNFQLLPILIPVAVISLLKLRERDFAWIPLFVATLTLMLVEIFYVNDPYTGKFERLNTVFKTYVQVWIMLSFASAFLVSKLRRYTIVALFIALLWIYPVGFLTTLHFKGTIDGMAYTKSYGEYDALRFLQQCPNGIIVEYPGKSPFESYTYTGRVSAFTGLQSVIVRGGHELFWRYFNESTVPMLYERWRDVNRIYEAKDLEDILGLIEKYHIRYIYVGYLEKLHYPPESLKKFEKLKKIYDDGRVEIYEVTFLTEKSNSIRR